MTQRGVLLSLLLLAPCSATGQDYFPGFEAAAQTDVIHVTSNILAQPDDDLCAFDANFLAAVAELALARNRFEATVVRPSARIEGVSLDVSAVVLPVLDSDSCAVTTRIQLVISGDTVVLAAEHFNLLTWTTTGLVRRVLTSVNRDVSTIAAEMRRLADAGQ